MIPPTTAQKIEPSVKKNDEIELSDRELKGYKSVKVVTKKRAEPLSYRKERRAIWEQMDISNL